MTIIINTRILLNPTTGVQRYLLELLQRIPPAIYSRLFPKIADVRSTENFFADQALLMRYEEWDQNGGLWHDHGVAQMLSRECGGRRAHPLKTNNACST